MNEQTSKERGKKEGRSPGYPAISVGAAIERAAILMEKGKRQFVPLPVIFTYWGYGTKSSMGMILLASLKKYGLIEDRGSLDAREARITDLAWKILVDDRPDSEERAFLIREAALNPAIHRKLWNDFSGQLPPDDHLKHTLLTKEGFTRRAVDDFIRQFRATIQFAKLEESDRLVGHEEDKTRDEKEYAMPPELDKRSTEQKFQPPLPIPPPVAGPSQEFNMALSEGKTAYLRIPHSLNRADWDKLSKLLDVLEPPDDKE